MIQELIGRVSKYEYIIDVELMSKSRITLKCSPCTRSKIDSTNCLRRHFKSERAAWQGELDCGASADLVPGVAFGIGLMACCWKSFDVVSDETWSFLVFLVDLGCIPAYPSHSKNYQDYQEIAPLQLRLRASPGGQGLLNRLDVS